MPPPGDRPRERVGAVLAGLGVIVALLAAFAAAGGGFDLRAGGLRVSLHSPANPLFAAVLLILLGMWAGGRPATRRALDTLSSIAGAAAPWLAAALAAGVLLASLRFGAFVAGSADSSGYLSQARLWTQASVTAPARMPGDVTLTQGLQAFVPLGYRPASTPGALVPTYPPGFPWLLAAAGTLDLERFVVPLSAAGVVWLTFLLGRRLGGDGAGLIGAAFAAGCPSLWYQAMQPMSDVPATFWLTASGLLLTRASTTSALGAGLAAAMGGLVRPNLFVLAPVLACGAAWWHRLDAPARRRRVAAFLLPVAAAAAGFAAWQRALFGGPTETGYGSVADLFSLEHVLPNLARYPAWVLETQTPLILAALAAPLVAARRPAALPSAPPAVPLEATRVAWVGLLVFATLLAFYALYLVFDEWVYVRFLLPALPWMFVLSGAVLAGTAERLPGRGLAPLVTLAAALMIATAGIGRARESGALDVGAGEQRFVAMADLVRASPPDAVVLAMQHSGSLAYYTDRVVIRWDWIEPAELPGLIETLRARGRAVYAVLDDWEVSRFNDRFERVPFALPVQPIATDGSGAIAAAAYRLSGTTADGSGVPVNR